MKTMDGTDGLNGPDGPNEPDGPDAPDGPDGPDGPKWSQIVPNGLKWTRCRWPRQNGHGHSFLAQDVFLSSTSKLLFLAHFSMNTASVLPRAGNEQCL